MLPNPERISSKHLLRALLAFLPAAIIFWPAAAFAAGPKAGFAVLGIPLEFIIFGLTLAGVAVFHHHTLQVALTGLGVLLAYKLGFTDFSLWLQIQHEKVILLNLLGLLVGFAILAKHFENSNIPDLMPAILPDDWKGGFMLLSIVMVLSAMLDNIAACIIGGTVASHVFKHRVHIGFLAAIVAASNAGGAGSVVGDTTTTMMWIDGVSALDVFHAFTGSFAAFAIFGIIAAFQQHKYQPIIADPKPGIKIDWGYLYIVAMILAGAIITNVTLDMPAVGVWVAILLGAFFRKTDWHEVPEAFKGSLFLLSLVFSASIMPVDELPIASWQTALGLGFLSSVFDNIPLTKMALVQGGYDWGVLAYTVGFGGSMVWFGSSAGVALSTMYPDAKSVLAWVKSGWHVPVAYVFGFFFMLAVHGWEPHAPHKERLINGNGHAQVEAVVTGSEDQAPAQH